MKPFNVFRVNGLVERIVHACRGFGLLYVESCRVQYDTTSFVRIGLRRRQRKPS